MTPPAHRQRELGRHGSRFVVLSGCSGGGKSSLLGELARRGHPCVEEPGRRIVVHELATAGAALPWSDPEGFARRAVELARVDLASVDPSDRWVFFDRSLVDAATALAHVQPEVDPVDSTELRSYHRQAFMTPPWPELYACDSERRHSIDEAVAEFQRLTHAYGALGYELITVPQRTVEQTADFVLECLAGPH